MRKCQIFVWTTAKFNGKLLQIGRLGNSKIPTIVEEIGGGEKRVK
jgi:hypothetical protein